MCGMMFDVIWLNLCVLVDLYLWNGVGVLIMLCYCYMVLIV